MTRPGKDYKASPIEEVAGEQGNVFPPLPQRRQDDGHDAQPVEEVFPEFSFRHQRRQILVGRGEDPDVHLDAVGAADAPHLAFLEHAQELRLHARAHLADLVEEARPARRRFEEASLVGERPRERTLEVAEQLALEERLGEGAAIDGHEWTVGPAARRVDGAGDQLLPGARLALDEHRARRRGDARDNPVHIEHALGGADHPVRRVLALGPLVISRGMVALSLAGDLVGNLHRAELGHACPPLIDMA